MSDELWLAVIQAAASILTVAITVLLPMLLVTLRQKKKLEITAAEEAQLEHAALEAVMVVKELAAARVKKHGAAMAMKPGEKLSTAINTVTEALPDKPRADVERKVTAALVKVGEGAAVNPQPAPGL